MLLGQTRSVTSDSLGLSPSQPRRPVSEREAHHKQIVIKWEDRISEDPYSKVVYGLVAGGVRSKSAVSWCKHYVTALCYMFRIRVPSLTS